MRAWFVVCLVAALAEASPQIRWEPCKVQCAANFKGNDLSQQALPSVCERGCDLFTGAFSSKSAAVPSPALRFGILVTKLKPSRDLPLEIIELHTGHNHKTELVKEIAKKSPTLTTLRNSLEQSSPSNHDDNDIKKNKHNNSKDDKNSEDNKNSGKTVEDNKNTNSKDKKNFKDTKNNDKTSNEIKTKDHDAKKEATKSLVITEQSKPESPASKTTMEPTSQPVQDRPVEASKQTTTTNGPRRGDTSSKVEGNEEKVLEVKQINQRKHIAKHSLGSLMHFNMIQFSSFHADKEAQLKAGSEGKKSTKIKSADHKHNFECNIGLTERIASAGHFCRRDCVEAFATASEQEACVVGCNLQATTALLKPDTKASPDVAHQPRSPFGTFQHFVFNLAGSVGKFMRTSWSKISSSTHARSPALPEKPQVFVSEGFGRGAQMPLPFINLGPASFPGDLAQNRLETRRPEQETAMKPITDDFFLRSRSSPFENAFLSGKNPFRIITFKKESYHYTNNNNNNNNNNKENNNEDAPQDRPHHHNSDTSETESRTNPDKFVQFGGKMEEELNLDNPMLPHTRRRGGDASDQPLHQHQLDLLECISRKSGLPRWFIAITIFTSAIVVLWLCFSLTAPPDDIKVVKTKPPELETLVDDEDDDLDDDDLTCNEKKNLLRRVDDVIKIRIQTV